MATPLHESTTSRNMPTRGGHGGVCCQDILSKWLSRHPLIPFQGATNPSESASGRLKIAQQVTAGSRPATKIGVRFSGRLKMPSPEVSGPLKRTQIRFGTRPQRSSAGLFSVVRCRGLRSEPTPAINPSRDSRLVIPRAAALPRGRARVSHLFAVALSQSAHASP